MGRRIEKARINFNGKMVSSGVVRYTRSGDITAPAKEKIVWVLPMMSDGSKYHPVVEWLFF